MAKKSREVAQLRSELASLRELLTQRELKELRLELARMRMDFAAIVAQSAHTGKDAGQIDVRRDPGPVGARKGAGQIDVRRGVGQIDKPRS
jgi:hypothetical protein